MEAERSAKLRAFFARYISAKGEVRDARVERAFAAVAREPFAGPGPWHIVAGKSGYVVTPDDAPAFLYQDTLIALDPTRGINIGEPSLHARCLDAVALREGETVLHVGAGAGYYTAILAYLVGSGGRVHACEIEPDLAARAGQNLAGFSWITVEARSGIRDDLPEADAIYVNAGLQQPSRAWLDALRPGGRLLFPLQGAGEAGYGGMLLITRPHGQGEIWPARFVSRAGFIACQGAQDDAAGQRVTAAFADHRWQEVRSLRRDGAPDGTCWLAGDGWWLSTRPAS